MAIEPGGGEGGVLAKGELEEEEGGADEGDQDGVDEEEGEPALLDDHHGESPEGVEGGGEGPACEQVVRSAGPQLLILYIMFCCRTHGVGVDIDVTGYILVGDAVRVIEIVEIDQIVD